MLKGLLREEMEAEVPYLLSPMSLPETRDGLTLLADV
jgi:hypothetical protein